MGRIILAAALRLRRDRSQGRLGKPPRRRSRGRIRTLISHSRRPPRGPGMPRNLSGHHASPRPPPTGTNPGLVAGGRAANTRLHGKVYDAGARTGRTRPPRRRRDTPGHRTADGTRLTRRRRDTPGHRRTGGTRLTRRRRGISGHRRTGGARLTRRRRCPRRGRESRSTTRSRPATRRRRRHVAHLTEGDHPSAGTTTPVPARPRKFPRCPVPVSASSRTWPAPAR
jgi:hypothetical protein